MVVHEIMAMIQYYNNQYFFSKQVLSQFKVLKLKIYPCTMIYISSNSTAVSCI